MLLAVWGGVFVVVVVVERGRCVPREYVELVHGCSDDALCCC